MNDKCETCRFFMSPADVEAEQKAIQREMYPGLDDPSVTVSGYGECRKYALQRGTGMVSALQWCGEHEPTQGGK